MVSSLPTVPADGESVASPGWVGGRSEDTDQVYAASVDQFILLGAESESVSG